MMIPSICFTLTRFFATSRVVKNHYNLFVHHHYDNTLDMFHLDEVLRDGRVDLLVHHHDDNALVVLAATARATGHLDVLAARQLRGEYREDMCTEYACQLRGEYREDMGTEYSCQLRGEYREDTGTEYACQLMGEYSEDMGTEYACQLRGEY